MSKYSRSEVIRVDAFAKPKPTFLSLHAAIVRAAKG